MGKLIIKENGKQKDWVLAYEDANGYYAIDCYQHIVRLDSWAEAKNYANTNGGQTMGNGDYFYDTWEDLWEEMHDEYADPCEYETIEELKADSFWKWSIGEEIGGEIEYIEDEEEDDE